MDRAGLIRREGFAASSELGLDPAVYPHVEVGVGVGPPA